MRPWWFKSEHSIMGQSGQTESSYHDVMLDIQVSVSMGWTRYPDLWWMTKVEGNNMFNRSVSQAERRFLIWVPGWKSCKSLAVNNHTDKNFRKQQLHVYSSRSENKTRVAQLMSKADSRISCTAITQNLNTLQLLYRNHKTINGQSSAG